MDKNAMETKEFDIIILGVGAGGDYRRRFMRPGGKHQSWSWAGVPGSSAYNAHIENFCCVHGDSGQDLLKTDAQGIARKGQAADVFRKAKGLLTHPDCLKGHSIS